MPQGRFSNKKSINAKNLKNVPGNKPGVYRILNSSDGVMYVGMAKGRRLPDRILEHKGEFKGGTKFQYKITADKEAAERLEKREIKKSNPSKNKLK